MEVGFILEFHCTDDQYSVVIEDNGRVAYAYLLKNGQIETDVWLYNRCQAPENNEWEGEIQAPYANSKEFVVEKYHSGLDVIKNELAVIWEFKKNGVFQKVNINYKDELLAYIKIGEKPGYSNLVIKSGPLAKNIQSGRNSR